MSPEEVKTTTQPAEGVPGQTPGSQVPPSTPQGSTTEQTAGPTEVDSQAQRDTSKEGARPSDFYRDRKMGKRMTSIENAILDIQEGLKTIRQPSVPSQPQQQPFDSDKFLTDPEAILREREAKVREDTRRELLEKDVPELLKQQEQVSKAERQKQEALELLFPKSSPSAIESLEQRVRKNPERTAEIELILEESGLEEYAKINPKHAAQLTLQELDKRIAARRPQNPNVINKGLMGGTGTGGQVPGGKTMPTLAELQAQRRALDAELEKNSFLMNDPEFQKKRALIKEQLAQIYTENRGEKQSF